VGVNIRCKVILTSVVKYFQQCRRKAPAKQLANILHAILTEEFPVTLIGCMLLNKCLDVPFAGESAR
jgi:hypothetical protein